MAREIASTQDAVNPNNAATAASDFKDRLVKLIPSEIVTAYVTIQGIISGAGGTGNKPLLLWIIFVILFTLTPLYLFYVSRVTKWQQIVFTSIAFVVWVMAVGWPVSSILDFPSALIGSIVLVIYTLTIPFVYKG